MTGFLTAKQLAEKFPLANLSALPTSNPGGGKPWLRGDGAIGVGAYTPAGVTWNDLAGLLPLDKLPAHTHDDRYARLSGGNTLSGNQAVTGDLTASGNIRFSASTTASTPSVRFGSDTTTGFWQPAANQIGVTVQGTDVFRWAIGGIVYCFAPTFQTYGDIIFGSSGGPRLRNSSGALLVRNNADTANGDLQVANLTAGSTVTAGTKLVVTGTPAGSASIADIDMAGRPSILRAYGTGYGSQPLYCNADLGLALSAPNGRLIFGPASDAILMRSAASSLAVRNAANTLSGSLEVRTITTTAADHGAAQSTLILSPFNGIVTMGNSTLSFGSGVGGFVASQNVGFLFSQWTNNSVNGHEFGLYRIGTNTAAFATTQAATTKTNLELNILTAASYVTSRPRTATVAPNVTDIPSGFSVWWHDTVGNGRRYAYNDAGLIYQSPLLKSSIPATPSDLPGVVSVLQHWGLCA